MTNTPTPLEYGKMPNRLILLLTLVIAAMLASSLPAQSNPHATENEAQATPTWKTAIDARRKQLVADNGYGTDAPLREQLMTMRATDQAARGFASSSSSKQQLIQNLPTTDAELTAELKQIVQQKGWPTIAMVGIDASNAAMLILTHTADHAWQRQLLPQLEQLADTYKIDPSSLAFVVDKELVAEGKLQRYGTQFKYIKGGMAMYGGGRSRRARPAASPRTSPAHRRLQKTTHADLPSARKQRHRKCSPAATGLGKFSWRYRGRGRSLGRFLSRKTALFEISHFTVVEELP